MSASPVVHLINFSLCFIPFLLQFIFHNEGFDKPFFTTYLKTASFVLYLPWVGLRGVCQKHLMTPKTIPRTEQVAENLFEPITHVSTLSNFMVNEDCFCVVEIMIIIFQFVG